MRSMIPGREYLQQMRVFTSKLTADENEFIKEMIKLTYKSAELVPQSSEQEETIYIDKLVCMGLNIVDSSSEEQAIEITHGYKSLVNRASTDSGIALLKDMEKLSTFYDEDPLELAWYRMKVLLVGFVLNFVSKKDVPF